METLNFVVYVVIGATFLFGLFADLSARHVIRWRWSLAYIFMASVFFILYFYNGHWAAFNSLEWLALFLGFGMAWPQLISRLIIQQKIEAPVVAYLKNKVAVPVMIVLGLYLFGIIVLLQPSPRIISGGQPMIEEETYRSTITLLSAIIPVGIFFFILSIQRTAFCSNGLLYNGILWDWSSIKTYSWNYDKVYDDSEMKPFLDKNTMVELIIEPKSMLFPRQIRLTIHYFQNRAIERLLVKNIQTENN